MQPNAWPIRLVPVSLFVGLAEALAAFGWGHVHLRREASIADLAWEAGIAILVGTPLCAVPVFLLGLVLWGIARAFHKPTSLAGPPSRAIDRLPTVSVLIVAWVALRIATSESPLQVRVGVAVAALAIAGLFLWVPFARGARAWPALAAPVLALVSCFGVGAGGRASPTETRWVFLAAGLPVLVVGVGWALGRWRPAVGVLACATGLVGWGVWILPAGANPPIEDRPNVMLVVVDTLRADRVVGLTARMPNLSAFAEGGTTFTRAYTVIPKTQQSVSSLMTGLYPWHHGVRTLHQRLRDRHTTLAERFARAGYHTAAFIQNPWLGYGMGHEQGFGEYYDYDAITSLSDRFWRTWPIRLLDRLAGRRPKHTVYQVDGRILTDRVTAWLEDPPDRPWFVWVHYFDPHWPYLPPATAVGAPPEDYEAARVINDQHSRTIRRGNLIFHALENGITLDQVAAARRLYDGEVRYVDQQLDRILDRIPGDGSTLVTVTADHGESLGEHGYFFHHGEYTYEDSLRIPLVVWWPGHVAAGRVEDAPVVTVDLAPTLLTLAGLEPGRTDGLVLPGLAGADPPPASRVIPFESDVRMFSQNRRIHLQGVPGKWRGVVQDDRKLIVIPTRSDPEMELYELSADPGELFDLHADDADGVQALLGTFSDAGLNLGGRTEKRQGSNPAPSAAETERLQALGYVD
ncbi:MAG: sulfatase-like hydrolase/transferase [Deltaproteobacteria bacterium]|nr:sulfatase-like hydrolase/transferase [Deltaproteobacteria bacterium]